MTDADRSEARLRLVIDLAACDRCERCGVACAAADGAADGAGAMLSLREHATFELVCRRCQHASCIVACPFDALERGEDGIVKRHNLRCVSCKSCAVACPFGTIYAELLPFYNLAYDSACKACLEAAAVGAASAAIGEPPSRLKSVPQGNAPSCVATCSQGALEWRVVAPDEPDVHIVDDFVAARVRRWVRQEAAP